MPPRDGVKTVAEALGAAMLYREAADAELPGREGWAGLQFDKLQRHRRARQREEASEILPDKTHRLAAAADPQSLAQIHEAQRCDEAAQAQHMIEMGMRQQHMAEPAKAAAGAEHLPLRPLAAIDQEPLAAGLDQHRRQAAFGRGRAGRGPEKGHLEHLTA